jgi:hypothetical protein
MMLMQDGEHVSNEIVVGLLAQQVLHLLIQHTAHHIKRLTRE